jgi:DeoR family myo-inositol catabolism operon transcriptional repressor
LRTNRLNELEAFISAKRTATTEEICRTFSISKNTARRDIVSLENKGCLKRVYGGVVSTKEQSILDSYEERDTHNQTGKELIGKIAAGFVEDGDTIFLDSGTTTVKMIPYLVGNKTITVVTHSMEILAKAIKLPNLTTIVIGGQYNPKTSSFFSQDTVAQIDALYIEKAFISTTGLTVEAGLTNHTYQEMVVKNKVMSRSNKKYLLVDSQKIGKNASRCICALTEFHALITDICPEKKLLNYCKENGISVLYGKKNKE